MKKEVLNDVKEFQAVNRGLDGEITEERMKRVEERMKRVIEGLNQESVSKWLDAQKLVISCLSPEDLAKGDTYIDIIVVTELADLGISPEGDTAEMYANLCRFMKGAALRSRDNYPLAPEEGSSFTQEEIALERKNAVNNASVEGIKVAREVIKVVIPEETITPKELVERTSIQDLAQHTIDQLNLACKGELSLEDFDLNSVVQTILEAAPNAWLTGLEQESIKLICSNMAISLNDNQMQALVLAATSVHVSWASIQGRRTVYEQGDNYQQFIDARRAKGTLADLSSPSESRLSNDPRFEGLRIFKDTFATLPAMMVGTFRSNYESSIKANMSPERAMNKALGLAIFELMKDLVKIAE
jgi:hypothetical protein